MLSGGRFMGAKIGHQVLVEQLRNTKRLVMTLSEANDKN